MKYYINVSFSENSKHYYFQTDDESLRVGDKVVVDTTIGREIGSVETAPLPMETIKTSLEVKPILRKATSYDLDTFKRNLEDSIEAKKVFIDNVTKLNLDMTLVDAQYTLDKTKILFIYVATDRIDFRELLKILAGSLHCRIELRQINTRERAQSVGGLGVCGLPLCCATFFKGFEGVSLNKAKNQMLAISIPKISGQCGKLMCCLKYEDDLYTEAKKEFPAINTQVKYNNEIFFINGYNILSRTVKIQNQNSVEYISLEECKKIIVTNNNFTRPNNNNNNNNKNRNNNNNNNRKK